MLSKKDIEELATGAVKRYFNTCNLVSPQIQEMIKLMIGMGNSIYTKIKKILEKIILEVFEFR